MLGRNKKLNRAGSRGKMNTMKKLMIAASAALCAAVGFADGIQSNIVGYNTITLKPGFNLIAFNFKTISNNEGVAINDLFPGGGRNTGLVAGNSLTIADTIQFYENGDYVSFFLYKPTKGTAKQFQWVDTSLNITDRRINNGDAFWYLNRAATNVTVTTSGEVELSEMKTVSIAYGFNMIGSFFPAGWTVNDVSYYTPDYWRNSGAVANNSLTTADCIQTYIDGNYITYFLYKPTKGTVKQYMWVDTSLNPVEGNILEGGQGAWYLHRGAGMTLEILNQTGVRE